MAKSLLYNRYTRSITYFQVTVSTRLVALPAPQAWLSVHQGFPALVSANAHAPLHPLQQPRPYRNQAEISVPYLTASHGPWSDCSSVPTFWNIYAGGGTPSSCIRCCAATHTAVRSSHDARAESSLPKQHQLHSVSRNKLPRAPGPLFWCGRAPVAVAGSAALFSVLRLDCPSRWYLISWCFAASDPQPPSDFSIRIGRPFTMEALRHAALSHSSFSDTGRWRLATGSSPRASCCPTLFFSFSCDHASLFSLACRIIT